MQDDPRAGVAHTALVKQDAATGRRAVAAVLVLVYLGATWLLLGLRKEHVLIAMVLATLIAVGGRALDFMQLYTPVMATGIAYDFFRLVAGLHGSVHVADLYGAELALFAIETSRGALVPSEYLALHAHPALDLACGVSYILYLYVPLVVAFAMFFVDRRRMLIVGLAFLFTTLLGLAIYLAYPAAPPWYVAKYGLGPALQGVSPEPAGAARFDALLGIDYFTNFYQRNASVYGAMPSLHVAQPLSTLLAVAGLGKRWSLPLLAFTLLVSFAAVYLQHHYVLDVIAGLLCGAVGYGVARVAGDRIADRWPAAGGRTAAPTA